MDRIVHQIVLHALHELKRQNREAKFDDVKNNLWIFVNASIDSPIFDLEAKEALSSSAAPFVPCKLPHAFLDEVLRPPPFKALPQWRISVVKYKNKS